ncbi:MAG TPA: hypothetical protein VIM65_14770 [Cyclobacteriaceae bacterium]
MKHLTIILYFFLATVFSVSAQSSAGNVAVKLIDDLVGSWKLSKVYDGKKEISTKSQKGIIDLVEFTRENMYMLRTNDATADSGFFRTNEIDQLLYLESANKVDGNGNTTDEWGLRLNKNTMTLFRREPIELRRFRYVYRKIK